MHLFHFATPLPKFFMAGHRFFLPLPYETVHLSYEPVYIAAQLHALQR
jgi:hypothetical protein